MIPIDPVKELSKVIFEDFKENKKVYIKLFLWTLPIGILSLVADWIYVKITNHKVKPEHWK